MFESVLTVILAALVFLLILTGVSAINFPRRFTSSVSAVFLPPVLQQGGVPTTGALVVDATPSATSYITAPACWSAVNTGLPCTPVPPTVTPVPSATPTPNTAATQVCRYYESRGTPCPP